MFVYLADADEAINDTPFVSFFKRIRIKLQLCFYIIQLLYTCDLIGLANAPTLHLIWLLF